MEEYFEIVDELGNVIGLANRKECHNHTFLLHRVSHIIVFNLKDELYLQKRADTKDIQPGKWDTSVGGHLLPGETYEIAAYRELREELGIVSTDITLEHLYDYIWQSDCEQEMVRTFKIVYGGPIIFDPKEIETGRFWRLKEIEANLRNNIFTPNFVEEYQRMGDFFYHLGW